MFPQPAGPGQSMHSQPNSQAQQNWMPGSQASDPIYHHSREHAVPDTSFLQRQALSNPYPPQPRSDRPEMTAYHPVPQQHYQPQDQSYRLPPPANFAPQTHMQSYPQQPASAASAAMNQQAPRQRTAIACKYCRRRKIRCSGFDQSEDGRCSNCVRFSQECIFTPVSQQTQAFVPAQAVYGRGGPRNAGPQQLYGAFGQPLGLQQDPYGQQAGQSYGMSQQIPYGQQPGSSYSVPLYGQQPLVPLPQHQQQYQDPSSQAGAPRRRTRDEPHTPTLPPPNPGHMAHIARHSEGDISNSSFAYPDPSGFTNGATSPASSTTSYQSHLPAQQPYYAPQAPPQQHRRQSPGSVYSYDHGSRESSSPQVNATYQYTHGPGQPLQHTQPHTDGRTSLDAAAGAAPGSAGGPPGSKDGARMRVHELVADVGKSGEKRSAADSSMVSALNKPRLQDPAKR